MTDLTDNEKRLLDYITQFVDGIIPFHHYFTISYERVGGLLHITVKDIRHPENLGYHRGLPGLFEYILYFRENFISIIFKPEECEFVLVCIHG